MKVVPYDNIHAFLVESEGTDKEMAGSHYLVRLDEHGGIGECSCKTWHCRIWVLIRDGVKPVDLFDKRFRCKHISAARRYQYSELFHALIFTRPMIIHPRNHSNEQRTIPAKLA